MENIDQGLENQELFELYAHVVDVYCRLCFYLYIVGSVFLMEELLLEQDTGWCYSKFFTGFEECL
jgi:hypothetical protein